MLETRVARSSRTGLSVAPHSCVCSSRSRTLALEAVYQVADISACKSMFLYDSRRCMVSVCPRPVYAWGSVSLRHDAGFEMPTGESSDSDETTNDGMEYEANARSVMRNSVSRIVS